MFQFVLQIKVQKVTCPSIGRIFACIFLNHSDDKYDYSSVINRAVQRSNLFQRTLLRTAPRANCGKFTFKFAIVFSVVLLLGQPT